MSLDNQNEKNDMNLNPPAEQESSMEDLYASFENPEVHTKTPAGGRKKKERIILISMISVLACIAIVITLFLTVFKKEGPENEDDIDLDEILDTSVVLLDKTPADENQTDSVISSVTCKAKDYTTEIINKDGALRVKGYDGFTMHAINMAALDDVLTKTIAANDIGEVTSLADYGLDAPTLTVNVTYTDGTTAAWAIGALTPDESGFYVHKPGSKHVYIMSPENVNVLRQKPLEYISTTVFTEPIIKDSSEGTSEVVLKEMTMSGSLQEGKDFSFRMVTSEDSDAYIYYNYIITKPYLKGANSGYDTELKAFTSLGAAEVLCVNPTAAQLKEYGFNNPYSVMHFTLSQRTTLTSDESDGNTISTTKYKDLVKHTMYVTKADSDYYYVMIDEKPVVYLVAVADLRIASMKYDDFADTMLFLQDITEMETFKVTSPELNVQFHLSHNASITDTSKNMTVTADGKTYDTMDFRYLINNFMSIERYGALTQSTAGLPVKMEFSIIRINETTPVLSAKFYEISSSVYAVELSHGERYTVKASDVDFVIEQCRNYLNGKTVLRK